ncbi:hypothetical protein [Roseivirga seohaensis]|uniref:hypothetical protein n=1 Tax=Roseivirga seohaensis TaxID=1914963 RepID=UPI003BA9694B
MTKPKAKTYIEQLGFFDEDLKTNTHDDILVWAANNLNNIVNHIFWRPWNEREYKYHISEAQESIRDNIPKYRSNISRYGDDNKRAEILKYLEEWNGIPFEQLKRSPFYTNGCTWEYPIKNEANRYKSIIGFIDLHFKMEYQSLYVKDIPHPNSNWDKFEIGSIALTSSWQSKDVFIEAKTKINSVGELLRQINFYREYAKGNYIVISPDDRYEKTLNEQGVAFVKAFHSFEPVKPT